MTSVYDFTIPGTPLLVQEHARRVAEEDWPRVPAAHRVKLTQRFEVQVYAGARANQLLRKWETGRDPEKGALTNNWVEFASCFRRGYTLAFVKHWEQLQSISQQEAKDDQ